MPGLTRGRALRFFGLAQGFVDDHLQVGLVAQAALGGLDAGFGDVFGVEADGVLGSAARLAAVPIPRRPSAPAFSNSSARSSS